MYPNFMHLSCDEGFILRGPSEIHCQANGSWSNSSTFCEGLSIVLFHMFLGVVSSSLFRSTKNCSNLVEKAENVSRETADLCRGDDLFISCINQTSPSRE